MQQRDLFSVPVVARYVSKTRMRLETERAMTQGVSQSVLSQAFDRYQFNASVRALGVGCHSGSNDRAPVSGHESCLVGAMHLRWFRARFAPKGPEVGRAQRDEWHANDRKENVNSLRNSLVEAVIQRDLTCYVGIIVAALAVGMFLTVFYSFAYVLMVRFNAVIERAVG
jgi:hypothetical protein